MSSDVEEIKNRLNIVDVLGDYIRLEKAGGNWRAICPFHNEKSPSFMVSEEKQIWHCFGCQKGGDIFGFVMEMEGLEFREALKNLAEKAGVELKKLDPRVAEVKNRTLEILEMATKFYEHQLWNGPGKTKIMHYLKERGLSAETIKEFRLGYAPRGWDNIVKFLIGRGYKIEEIAKTGLLVNKNQNREQESVNKNQEIESKNQKIKNLNADTFHHSLTFDRYYDRFRARVMFPIADYSGKILGYSARVAPGEDESQAKYINTPESEVYHKSRILYGIDKARAEIKRQDFVLLVEGNMDVIAAWQSGIKNVLAVSGTALTEEQIGIIKRYTKNIKMFFDMDSAGENATKKSVKLCLANEMSVKIVTLPSGKDAADLARENPAELIMSVEKARGIMEYFFENTFGKYNKNNSEERKIIIEDLLEKINLLKFLPDKNYWVKKLAEKINETGASILEDEKALTDMLKKVDFKNKNILRDKDKKDDKEFISRERMVILIEELLGLMLVSEEIWRKVISHEEYFRFFPKDELLEIMLEKGELAGYSFEKLSKMISRKNATRAEKFFMQKKFRLGLNNNPEEITIDDPLKEFDLLMEEIKRETKKIKLENISRDLKLARERGDREAEKFLSKELASILAE